MEQATVDWNLCRLLRKGKASVISPPVSEGSPLSPSYWRPRAQCMQFLRHFLVCFRKFYAAWHLPETLQVLSCIDAAQIFNGPYLAGSIVHAPCCRIVCRMKPDEQLPSDSNPEDGSQPSPDGADRPLIIRSETLLQGRREVWIEHGNEMYRLRITSSGKLYLTK